MPLMKFLPLLICLLSSQAITAHAVKYQPSPNGNYFLVFNPNKEVDMQGERTEFTTQNQLENWLKEQEIPRGWILLGLGIVTEFEPVRFADRWKIPSMPDAISFPYAPPNAKIKSGAAEIVIDSTAHDDDRFGFLKLEFSAGLLYPIKKDTPISFVQLSVLNPDSAHQVTYGSDLRGSNLWSFRHDGTAQDKGPLGMLGLSSMYDHTDGGKTHLLYDIAKSHAHKGDLSLSFSPFYSPGEIAFFKSLSDDLNSDETTLTNFKNTLPIGLVEREILKFYANGHDAVAVRVEGEFSMVNHFRTLEINRRGTRDAEWHMAKGGPERAGFFVPRMLGSIGAKLGVEIELRIPKKAEKWTMAGFFLNPKTPNYQKFLESSDAFRQGYHVHGHSHSLQTGGHVLTAAIGKSGATVTYYPIKFGDQSGGFVFNNDVKWVEGAEVITPGKVQITLRNQGVNFIRALTVYQVEMTSINNRHVYFNRTIEPMEEITFDIDTSSLVHGYYYYYEIDQIRELREGGEGHSNNTVVISKQMDGTIRVHYPKRKNRR